MNSSNEARRTVHLPCTELQSQATDVVYGFLNRFTAAVLLILVSPAMILIAIMIRRSSGGRALFTHYRVGLHGNLFKCLKFQTMVNNADSVLEELLSRDPAAKAQWARDQKLLVDPRITPIGQFLRKSSLDELPQLFNVLRGEMNLVGPRPIVVPELGRYGTEKRHYLSVKPGMTGLWQVSGRNLTTYGHRVELDRRYVIQRSLWLDMNILLKTVRVVFSGYGAH
jgi:exopolysaccharide production protein ExoY